MAKKALLTFFLLFSLAQAARLRGTIYDANLSPIDRAIVTVNSTPAQRSVALNGTYQLFLPPGYYRISAEKDNASVVERIAIAADGEYQLDLIALELHDSNLDPPSFNDLENLSDMGGIDYHEEIKQQDDSFNAFAVVAVAIVSIAIVAGWRLGKRQFRKAVEIPPRPGQSRAGADRKVIAPVEKTKKADAATSVSLDDDERKIVDAIMSLDGRTSQKELRRMLGAWSEARVSLELTKLEEKGVIVKTKKGRGNMIRLG